MRQKRAHDGRTPSYWPYDQVVTACLILRPRAMQVINCASWHGQQRRQAVARRDSMPQVRRIPMKTSKNREKKKKIPKKSAPAAGRGNPSPPRMDTLWGPRAGPERGDARVAPPCPTTSCVWRSLPYLTLTLMIPEISSTHGASANSQYE